MKKWLVVYDFYAGSGSDAIHVWLYAVQARNPKVAKNLVAASQTGKEYNNHQEGLYYAYEIPDDLSKVVRLDY